MAASLAGAARDEPGLRGTRRAGRRQPANSAPEKSGVWAPRKRLSRPTGSEGARGCGQAAAAGAAPYPTCPAEPPPASCGTRGLRPRCHSPTRLFRSDRQVRHLPCSGSVPLRRLFDRRCAPCGIETERIPGELGPLPRGWAGAALPAAAGSGESPGWLWNGTSEISGVFAKLSISA